MTSYDLDYRADSIRASVENVLRNEGYGCKTYDGYMGATAWTGNRCNRRLYGAELSKTLRDDLRDVLGRMGVSRSCVNVSCKTYTGGQSVRVSIKAAAESAIMDHDAFVAAHDSIPYEYWVMVDGVSYHRDELARMDYAERDAILDKWRADMWNAVYGSDRIEFDGYHIAGDGACFTDWAIAVGYAAKFVLNSYNSDDSNSMVDYFDRGFYEDVVFILQ